MATPRASVFPAASGDGVFAGIPRPPGWDTGADAGSLVGNVWTPALGPNGLVNAASVALVPLSTAGDIKWVEVAGTRLDSLDSAVRLVQPGWSDRGTGDPWVSVLRSYSGMAFDVRAGYERGFVSASGGHFGGSNDGSYGINFRTMQWWVVQHPWNQANMDPAYKLPDLYSSTGSFTGYPLAQSYYSSNPSNAEGVYGDEFFDPAHPTDPAYSPRRPTPRHPPCFESSRRNPPHSSPNRKHLSDWPRRFRRLRLGPAGWARRPGGQ